MINFWDIAGIVFVCTAANHIGPIPDIEAFLRRKLPIVGCIKCLTFWSVLVYGLSCCGTVAAAIEAASRLLAISFLCAWASIWLDLIMGIIDHLYLKVYDSFYPTANPADTDAISPSDPVPDVPDGNG